MGAGEGFGGGPGTLGGTMSQGRDMGHLMLEWSSVHLWDDLLGDGVGDVLGELGA